MKIVAIVQAHMGSTRLPGKVLRLIGERTMLARVVRRASRARSLSEVVVACSTEPDDAAIVRECDALGIRSFRGSDSDVLDRFLGASREFPADGYVRITSDCPVIDPEVVDMVVDRFVAGGFDYVSNTVDRTFPRGLDTEVFSREGLEKVAASATVEYERVHVTPRFYRNPDQFRIGQVTQDADQSALRWTVDTPDDLAFLTAVYRELGGGDTFSWRDVLALVQKRPDLADMNSHVRQKGIEEL